MYKLVDFHYFKIKKYMKVYYNKSCSVCRAEINLYKKQGIDEIKCFIKNDMVTNHPIHKAIGFQTFKSNIEGVIDNDLTLEKFQIETRNYAKRQITWFKNRSIGANFLPYNKVEDFILKNF